MGSLNYVLCNTWGCMCIMSPFRFRQLDILTLHICYQIRISTFSIGCVWDWIYSFHYLLCNMWVGVGDPFLRWRSPSNMWVGPLIFFKCHQQGCLNNPIFSNLGLYATCWACFICHHELWPIPVSHPFSLGLAGGKHYQKITIPIFRLVL